MKIYYTYTEFKDCPEATAISKDREFYGTILSMASLINLVLAIIFLIAFVSEDWTVILYVIASVGPVIYMFKYYPIVTDRKIKKAMENSRKLKEAIATSKYKCHRISLSDQYATGSCRICFEDNKSLTLCTIKNDIGTRNIYVCDCCIFKFTNELLSRSASVPLNNSSDLPSVTPAQKSKIKKSVTSLILILLLTVVIISVAQISNAKESPIPSLSSPSQPPTAATEPPVSLKRLPTPVNGAIIFDPVNEKVAPLSVKTTTYDNCYLILTEHGSQKVVMSFFVRANSTAEVHVPIGNYDIYYAVGESWYGTEHLFGDSTYRAKFDESFLFTKEPDGYSGWTIEMQPVSYGNLESDPINADDFPS